MPFSSKPVSGHAILEELANDLWRKSGAERWGLEVRQFVAILEGVSKKHLHGECAASELQDFLEDLRLEELALARACAAGNEYAWTELLIRYRERLYAAAVSMAKKEALPAGRLADDLWVELHQTKSADGGRILNLESYSGRGSLDGWLYGMTKRYMNSNKPKPARSMLH